MSNRVRLILAVLIGLMVASMPLIARAQTATPDGPSYLLAFNFSPDSEPVDVYVNGQKVGDMLAFGEGSFPVLIDAGQAWVAVYESDKPLTDGPVIDGAIIVGPNETYALPMMNLANRLQIGLYPIPVYGSLGENQTRTQWFNAVPEGPRVDIRDVNAQTTFLEALGYAEDPVTSGNFPAGTYNWQFWTNNEVIVPDFVDDPDAPPPALAYDLGDLTLEPQVVYSFYLIGQPRSGEVLAFVLPMPFGGGDPVDPPIELIEEAEAES
ncbi:MAG: DUF4397 domain-containing protein [Chloroflexi bacterium]|nr:DUF4397 domain-containing protein [Chloroflexota bacterium]